MIGIRTGLMLAAALCGIGPALAQDWFVDASAAPGGDGTSWSTAFVELQAALSLAQPGEEVWVADGLYRPTYLHEPPDPRSATFLLPPDVRIYGGFDGSESSLAQRAGLFDATVLSGDLGAAGDPADNAYHVVRMVGLPQLERTILDGFTIRDGNGLVPGGASRRGGGLHLSANGMLGPVLELGNCRVRANRAERGGGIAVLNLAQIFVRQCIVRDNSADLHGGGLFAQSSWSVRCYDTLWLDNSAQADGGAVYLNSTGPDSTWFVNCVFRGNSAERGGAALLHGGAFTAATGHWFQCTLASNQAASEGAAFHADPSSAVKPKLHVFNSIVWDAARAPIFGSGDVRRSIVAGGWPGEGNLSLDPLFVDLLGGDLRTLQGSPAHDSASNLLVPFDLFDADGDGLQGEPIPHDLDGRPRFGVDPLASILGVSWPGVDAIVVDMGAFEF